MSVQIIASPGSSREFATRREAVLPALFAMCLGALLVFGIGFAGPQHVHNAAHDSRHAFAFPCH
jgi:cobalt transporter subunit CbtB